MKDWFESSDTLREHTQHTFLAKRLFAANHPDETLNITKAQEEYATSLGLPSTYFRLHNLRSPQRITVHFQNLLSCDECNSPLSFERFSGCSQVNPRRLTGLFYCSKEECPFHFYVREPLLNLLNKINVGKLHSFLRIFPSLEVQNGTT